MDSARKSALQTGVLFIITFVTSIPALILYGPVLDNANYVLGAGSDTRITVGALLEVVLAAAGIGSAIAIFPILKKHDEGLALAYVTARVVESVIILVGVMSVMSVVTLRQDFSGTTGADAAAFVTAGKALVAVHKWSFLLGPGFCSVTENGLLLGYLMYRTGLLPRSIAVLGLVAGPLGIVAATVELFGAFAQTSKPAGLLDFPEFAFELLFGLWLIAKGFRPVPLVTGDARPAAVGEAAA